ncbi:MAG: cytochrome c biogenesis protein ResB [Lachnospiraceae bacterium]|nr:cytochrome c biogenesis protein ResB [Lachnospiraceae bacterium]
MSPIKKIWKFISSMQFAIILLVLLAIVCSIASFVTQGQTYAWYAQAYSERTAAVIVALHLDDAFHSWWFIVITGFLCVNLLLCNILKFPQNLRRMKNAGDAEKHLSVNGDVQAEDIREPEKLFAKLHFGKITKGSGEEYLFAAKNSAGYWGAWVCHLGILLVILGFGLGQMTKQTYTAYGVPGQSRAIGDTGYIITIDDFTIGHRADDTVEQYTSAITVRDAASGRSEQAEISVNNPASVFGLRFYQNSTGWAAKVHVDKDGEPLQDEIVCAGDYLRVKGKEDLVIYLNAFYPDYVLQEGVGPQTASSEIKNPAYLYSVYYMDRMLGMNALLEKEELKIDEYTVTFSEPQSFTLIQIKKDHFTWLALVGGLVTMLGLILAFYMQPAQMWALKQENGLWTIHGRSRKGGAIFREQFLEEATNGKE